MAAGYLPPVSASQASGQSKAADNFVSGLECPIYKELLKDAVLLAPCGHSISEVAARQLYRGMKNKNSVEHESPCPICRDRVQAYYPNRVLRGLLDSIQSQKLEEIFPLVSATIVPDPDIDLKAIPFPGKGAKFSLAYNHWKPHEMGGNLNREIRFSSQTSGSLFNNIEIFGYKDGNFRMFISYDNENRKIVSDYLVKCGIPTERINATFFWSNDRSSAVKIFKIITMHNEIPADYISFIRDAISPRSEDDHKEMALAPGSKI